MSLFEELKRRRVTRVALLYAAAAYAVVEIADVLTPALLLPEWTVRLVVVLLLLGAPIALVLAWMFDVRPTGPGGPDDHPTSESRTFSPSYPFGRRRVVVVGLVAGFLLGSDPPSDSPAVPTIVRPPPSLASIAVLPFQDMSAEGDQQYFADGMAEELLNHKGSPCGLSSLTSRPVDRRLKVPPHSSRSQL